MFVCLVVSFLLGKRAVCLPAPQSVFHLCLGDWLPLAGVPRREDVTWTLPGQLF